MSVPEEHSSRNEERLARRLLTQDLMRASEFSELRNELLEFSRDELGQIPILPTGNTLVSGQTYLDLHDPLRRPFVAGSGHMVIDPHRYVPRAEVDERLWLKLQGEEPFR